MFREAEDQARPDLVLGPTQVGAIPSSESIASLPPYILLGRDSWRITVVGEEVTLVRALDPGQAECGAAKLGRPRHASCNATKQILQGIGFCRSGSMRGAPARLFLKKVVRVPASTCLGHWARYTPLFAAHLPLLLQHAVPHEVFVSVPLLRMLASDAFTRHAEFLHDAS